ncbi:MAG: hypothetical protein HDT44_09225 [Ruminococcaceae bacterium]|nr:hypothetical protein [Oscillospiraceae bacterium]
MVQSKDEQSRIRMFPLGELISGNNSEEDIQRLTELLSSFSCEKDKDVEYFLHREGRFVILGYFTLALKVLDLPENLSNNMRKRLDGISAKLHGDVIRSIPCTL